MELHEPPSVALTKLLGLIAPQLVNKLQVTRQTNKSIIVFLIIIIAPFYPIGRVGFLGLKLGYKGKDTPYMLFIFSVIYLARKIALFCCRKCKTRVYKIILGYILVPNW